MEEAKQPSGKYPKLSDGDQNMDSIDRLSRLPDEVICHILSFLPTKRSVATSVLRKRWRFLWAHVPCLHFSVDDLTKEGFWEEETQASDDFREERTRASDIINRVILRHKAKRVDTLTLSYVNCNEYQLDTLITTAIDRSIRNLYLEHSLDTFPRYLFNCKTIVDLKLYNYGVSLSAVDNVSLPSLKKFYVSNLVCENDDALPRFLSGCPSLEELNMAIHFGYDYVGCINITSPTIKTLKLDIDYIFRPSNLEYRMIINAPAITYLQVYGYDFALEWITIPTTMNSLVEADIHLKHYWFFLFHVKTYYNSMEVNFLHSLCYVKCLKISGWRLGELVHRGLACSTVKFDNLTKLEVELQLNFKWSLLVKFLQIADNLEALTCDQVELEKGYLGREPKHVPECLLSCLRTITIKSMRFKEHEFDMVRYLLRNSRVLERMDLFTCECIDGERKFEALKRISLFDRGSDACQLAFH